MSNARLKLKKNAKKHPEAELKLFDNYSHSSHTLSSENNRTYSKNWAKKQACVCSWDYTINHNEKEDENEKKIT